MKDIQGVYDTMEERKKMLKDLKDMYKDATENSLPYQNILERLQEIKNQKALLEKSIKDGMGKDYDKMEELKSELQSDKEMMTDIALTKLMQGETVELKDKYDNQYEPVFSVRFKKVK
jgi:predicted nuclease with TOPRIM domain